MRILQDENYSVELKGPEHERDRYRVERTGETLIIHYERNRDFSWEDWESKGISVDENGTQHYLDVWVSYRMACRHAIRYLERFGYTVATPIPTEDDIDSFARLVAEVVYEDAREDNMDGHDHFHLQKASEYSLRSADGVTLVGLNTSHGITTRTFPR